MTKILAIDYGTKRTGLAITDNSQIFSFPLDTVDTENLINYLKILFSKENISHIVIGKALHADKTPSKLETYIKKLIIKIKKEFPNLIIDRHDERYTSKMAYDIILSAGTKKKKRQNKSLVDKVSASLILQSYIEFKK